MKEIVFAGFGGQGVLTSGLIVSQIAVNSGLKATWTPSYGSAMRGGTANCTVKFGDGIIYNPSQEEPDILLAMNTPSFNKFVNIVAPGGTVVINSDMVIVNKDTRDDIHIIEIPCSSLAIEIGNAKVANIIMTGVIFNLINEFDEEEIISGMNYIFGKKGKNEFEELNIQAMKLGMNYIK